MIAEKGGSPNPNFGFCEQLEIWAEMGGKIDSENLRYRKFQMKIIQEIMMLDEGKEELAKIVAITPK